MSGVNNALFPRSFEPIEPAVNLAIAYIYQCTAFLVMAFAPLLGWRWMADQTGLSVFDHWMYLYLPYLVGVVFLVAGLCVFILQRKDPVSQVFAVFTASIAIGFFLLFDAITGHQLTPLWAISLAFASGALINLALIFPENSRLANAFPRARYLGYLPAGILIVILLPFRNTFLPESGYGILWTLEGVFLSLSMLVFITFMIFHRKSTDSPFIRDQAQLSLAGALIACVPLMGWFLFRYLWENLEFSVILLVPLISFPIYLAYAILKYRIINTGYLLSRVVLFAILTGSVAIGYASIVSGLSLIVGDGLAADNPYLIGTTAFLLALVINPVRQHLQERIDAVFLRGRDVYQVRLLDFSRELAKTQDLNGSLALFRKSIDDLLSPSILHIYTYVDYGAYYAASLDQSGQTTSDIRFSSNSSPVQTLSQRRTSIHLEDKGALARSFPSDRARLALLGARLFVPILSQSGLAGWLALGERTSGEPYSVQAIEYLEALCDQAALALARVQVVGVLEQRVQEMDTIARMAEGINVTLAFDDLLEMSYAQTSRLIPTTEFRITLGDEHGQRFNHVFFLENNERVVDKENSNVGIGVSLEAEVIRTRQGIITDEYARECVSRGISPDTEEIHAWMSLPLNAGSDTIGAVSLGSREPLVAYSRDHVNLLQALADLLAGAIVKARLLEESELRAKQMATLNELTRSLTSTLELDPLLERILKSAVEILDCESGSLLLVDEQTGDSIFVVALGPVGAELLGQRLPPGVGLVGKAVKTRQPIIQNDVRRSEDWFNTDDQTGYSTKDLLVVPMEIKDRVIGVLEVLNKKDRSPFKWDDLELLSAFAGQAAVAIENARLYTQTDQALAARVGELSVMQRIDRELNAGLDLERTMRITLEWSLSQSKAQAGLVGIVETEGLKVMATQGIPGELANSENPWLLFGITSIDGPIESGQIQSVTFPPGESGWQENEIIDKGSTRSYSGSLSPGAVRQIVVPVRREQGVIGIILLESNSAEAFSEEVVSFLTRLSDHAAIAFSNAQLYGAVHNANLAKSQFVSSAAHELKNPLTSIKGYSDLLIGGAVGPMSDGQARFLTTIRSNADRMSTLVSDLQDISRIEAGQLRLQFSSVSFVDIISEVVRTLRKQIEEKEQSLAILVPEDLPPVWGDNTRLVQVLTNLLSNAHKYTPQAGNLAIQAELVPNRLDPEGQTEVIHVAVKDNGIGISPEDQKKIFQQFFRSEDPKVREATGTGIGLSISRRLVEMQGGEIWFESAIGVGTTFKFTIPVAEAV